MNILSVLAAIGDNRTQTIDNVRSRGDGHFVTQHEGQEIIVNSLSGKLVYGFSTPMIKVYSTPLFYLHMAHPEFVQNVPVRESTRVAFSVIGMASGWGVMQGIRRFRYSLSFSALPGPPSRLPA